MSAGRDSESGMLVYPHLPVPKSAPPPPPHGRKSEPRPTARHSGKRRWSLVVGALVAAIAGGAAVWFGRSYIAPDPRIAAASERARVAETEASEQKQRADTATKSLETLTKSRQETEARLEVAAAAQSELAGKTADEAARRKAAESAQARLRSALDRSSGSSLIQGGDVHLQISDRAMFKPGDDALTDRGKLVLNRLAAAFKDLPDRDILVQGHTDDQPIALPKPPPPPPPPRKGQKAAPAAAAPAPVIRFPTNWELSAARAVAVVRYLQDVGKIDPSRLVALAYGQYAPLSRTDRAANRRLEIVVTAKRAPTR